ncbi:FAD assembly factor SdhE [Psychromonas sp. CD1]|uniref:FAD assembly factor SdhE n=1 Tax=Psychromonas sp. CD1 TaxID=1979839 RepID=UPI000B9BD563|nr:succinate dehydrogenase assembly factor 2 [Psychromonas sp. CD1]
MKEEINKSRLLWACRRGMLELDVLFMPFVTDAFDDLQYSQKLTFQRLLTHEDPDLFAWFMGNKKCIDTDLATMIHLILKRVKA